MVLWLAAFIISGILFPPDIYNETLVVALIVFSMLAMAPHWHMPVGPAPHRRIRVHDAAIRFALTVCTAFFLWTGVGVERGRIECFNADYRGASVRRMASTRSDSSRIASNGDRSMANETPVGRSCFTALRMHFSRVLSHPRLTPLSGKMMGALLLAQRSDLPWRIRDTYEYLGIAHFLALSGLHLGIIAVPIAYLLSLTGLPRFHRSGFLVGILFLYVAVVGFPPSLVRAVSLTAAMLLYRALSLKTGLMRPLVLGGIAVVCIDPATAMRAGYQLSFSAVCGITLIGLPLLDTVGSRLPRRGVFTIVRAILFPTLITVSIQLFTLPLVLSLFQRASLLAPAMNLLMMVPVSIFLYVGCVFLLLPVGPIRAVLAIPLEVLSRILRDLPAAFSHRPHCALYRGDIESVCYCVGIALLSFGLMKRRRGRAVLLASSGLCIVVSVVAGNGWNPARQRPILDEKIGDVCYLINCHPYILYLESDMSPYDGRRTVKSLWSRGVRSIGAVVVGDGGGRRGGIRHVLERIDVREIVCTPYFSIMRIDIMNTADALGVPVRSVSCGDTVACGDCTIEILQPRYPPRRGEIMAGRETRLSCRFVRDARKTGDVVDAVVLPPGAGMERAPDRE
jgi:ComEC/Rec2-related protein